MKSFHDLSRTIIHNESVYPGDPYFILNEISTVTKDGFSDFVVHGGMHVGTHIDAPGHMIKGGKLISDYPISKFISRAICFDVIGIEEIGLIDIQADLIKKNDIVLLNTGFEKYYGEPKYYSEHPIITKELAYLFLEKDIGLVGMDMPSPDYSPYPIHHILLANDILLIENMKGMAELPLNKEFNIWAFPMPLRSSAASIRVVAYY